MTINSYDPIARFLHHVIALIIIYTLVAGYCLHFTSGALKDFLSILNMSLATLATPVFIVRYIWRFLRNTPNLPKTINEFQQKLAKFTHSIMYLIIFLVFVSGFLMLSQPFEFFWFINVPNIINNAEVNEFFFYLHIGLCLTLSVLVTLHILAVIKHTFYHKNLVIRLMFPKKQHNL